MGRTTPTQPVDRVKALRNSRHRKPPRNTTFLLCAMLSGVVLSACASSGPATSRRTNNVITRDELVTQDLTSAYEAVQRLRPQWLRGRGATSIRNPEPTMPVVYVAGVRQGGPESLRVVRITETDEIRFISASDATTRWGTGHMGGAIEVILR